MKLIAAIAPKAGYAIGNNGTLPWRCSADLQHFSRVTTGGTLIMGRKTFESLPGPLYGRNIVVMSRGSEKIEGVNVARDMQSAINSAIIMSRCYSKIFVAGGAEIYEMFMPVVTQMLITWIMDYEGPADARLRSVEALYTGATQFMAADVRRSGRKWLLNTSELLAGNAHLCDYRPLR